MENEKTINELAVEKMRKELADEQAFGKAKVADELRQIAEKVVRNYLLKRCEEDDGFASDVMLEHKTLKRCAEYIIDEARQLANRAMVLCVEDARVYEWAEDYYRADDEALAKEALEREAKEEADRKARADKAKATKKAKKAEKSKAAADAKKTASESKKAEPETKKPKKSDRKKDEMEGQMDLFSLLG